MNPARFFLFATFALCFIFPPFMRAQQTSAERVSKIQAALRAEKMDGWLFYDFRHSDPLAYRILKLTRTMAGVAPLVLLRSRVGRTDKGCDVDRAVQTRFTSREKAHLSRLAGIASAFARNAGNKIRQGETNRDAVFADERRSLHVESRCRHDRTDSLVRRGDRHQRGTGATIRSRLDGTEQLQRHIEASDKMHRIFFDAFGEIARQHSALTSR